MVPLRSEPDFSISYHVGLLLVVIRPHDGLCWRSYGCHTGGNLYRTGRKGVLRGCFLPHTLFYFPLRMFSYLAGVREVGVANLLRCLSRVFSFTLPANHHLRLRLGMNDAQRRGDGQRGTYSELDSVR